MRRAHISKGYHAVNGTEPDSQNDAAMSCAPISTELRHCAVQGVVMAANHRFARSLLLVASLGASVAIAMASCGPMPAAPAPSPTAKANGSSGSAQRAAVADCLQSHGMSLPPGANDKQVRSAFTALPAAEQQRVFAACSSTLSSKLRQQLQAQMGQGTATP
jgi:hypothetical protein